MRARLVGFALSLIAFALYVFGASATLDGGDSGEFIAASANLGISHAPGYPLIALLLKAFQVLLPIGSVAYRCHVFSALTACALLVAVFYFFRENRAAALFAATFIAVGPLFVEQARVVEVFLLNGLFVVGILLCLQSARFPLATFLFGLAAGNHQTVVVVLPAFVFLALRSRPSAREWVVSAIALMLGLSIYIYLPIRAHAGPPVNFGDPETWTRFWAVITRKEFGSLSLHPAAVAFRDLALVQNQVKAFAERAFHQLGVGGVLLCGGGAVVGWMQPRTRGRTTLVLGGFLLLGIGFDVLANLSAFSDIGQWRLERFYLLPSLVLSGLAWFAFDAALRAQRAFVRIGGTAALLVLLAPSVWAAVATPGFRWNTAFRDFAISALRCAPASSRLVIDRVLFDEPTSALLVTTQVENKRPDIQFYYRPGTLFEPVYGRDVLELSWAERFDRQVAVERDLVTSSTPVRCLAFDRRNTPFKAPALRGLLYADSPGEDRSSFVLMRSVPRPVAADYPTRLIEVHTPYLFGKRELENGNILAAKRWFQRALLVGADMAWLHCNIGGLYAQNGQLLAAQRMFERSAELDPYFYEGHFGLGFVALTQGRNADAVASLERAVRVGPDRADGWYMLGVACHETGDGGCVRAAWQQYLTLEPNGAMAEVVRKKLQEP